MRSILGSKIYIGGMVDPAAEVDASSFAGADWIEIDGWTDRGPLGDVQAVGTQSRINRRRILKYKTTRSVNAMENQFVPLPLDPGQIRFKQAVASCRPYQFRIDTPGECGEEPSIVMFVALVLPGTRQGGPTEAAHIRSWSIAPLSNIYEYPALFLNAIFANNSALRSLRQNADGTGEVHAPGTPIGLAVDQSGHGNDAVQVVGTARPLLRVFPRGGVRNLLANSNTNSEDLTGIGVNAFASKTGPNEITCNGLGVARITISCGAAEIGRSYALQAKVKLVSGTLTSLGLSADGATGSGFSGYFGDKDRTAIVNAAPGEYVLCASGVAVADRAGFARMIIRTPDAVVLELIEFQISALPTDPYQQVISQHEIHQSGVPDIYGQLFDGADDWLGNMLDAPVDIAQTGAMIACAFQHHTGVVSAAQTVVSVGKSDLADGFFRIFVNENNSSFRAQVSYTAGGGLVPAAAPASSLNSGLNILIAVLKPSTNQIILRLNGVEYASAWTPATVTIDRIGIGALVRNTIDTYSDGTIADSLFVIGEVSDAQIQQLERQWSDKYGVPLA